jgi:biotin--protein ligase
LTEDDQLRTNFLKACLAKLGLKVNEDQNVVPSLSRIHISSLLFADTTNLLHDLSDIIIQENGQEYIKDENDTFLLEKPSTWSTESLKDALPRKEADEADEDRILDYNTIVKRVYFHENDLPLSRETPYFNHHAYFSNLTLYQETSPGVNLEFGKRLMYGEVVTSTNTLLEK